MSDDAMIAETTTTHEVHLTEIGRTRRGAVVLSVGLVARIGDVG